MKSVFLAFNLLLCLLDWSDIRVKGLRNNGKKKKETQIERINWKIPTIIGMIFCLGSTSFRMYIQAWNGSLKEFQHRFWGSDCLFQCLVYQICVHNFCLLQTLFSIMRGDCFFKNTFCWRVCNIYGLKCSNHSNLFFNNIQGK